MKKLFLFALVFCLAGLAYSGSDVVSQPSGQTMGKALDQPQQENPYESSVGARTVLGGNTQTWVQRGQSWWPYTTPMPPYSVELKRTEEMSVDEIRINDLVMLNIQKPELALAAMPKDLLLPSGAQLSQKDGYYLVKISGLVRTKEQLDELEAAGAVLGEYLHINTYIAKIPSSSLGAVKALSFVTWVGDYQPAYKISPQIGLTPVPPEEVMDPVTRSATPWLFELMLHAGAYPDDVVNDLRQLGIFPEAKDIVTSIFDSNLTTIFVRTSPKMIVQLAKVSGVKFILEHAFPKLLASSTQPTAVPMILQNNGAYTTATSGWKIWNQGIKGDASGTAQIVTMMDTGLAVSEYHMSQDTANVGTIGSSHRKVVGYDNYGGDYCVTAYSNTSADGGHGTFTTNHAVGSISNMTTNIDSTHTPNTYYDLGIAPNGKVYFQDIGTSSGTLSPPTDLGPSITTAIGKGSYIQSHSWGTSSDTYDTTAADLDTALYNNQTMVVCAAAGNGGAFGTSSIGSPATCKNAIACGGVDASVPNQVFEDCAWDGTASCASTDAGSGRGPGPSSRVKPDVLAYFFDSGTLGNESNGFAGDRPHAECETAPIATYWDFENGDGYGGTSYATPDIAGSAALVRDYFLAGFYPSGTLNGSTAVAPYGTLVKAMILASAEPMGTTAYPTNSITIPTRPSNGQGWGRIDLPSIMHFGSSAPYLWVQNNQWLNNTASKVYNYTILNNDLPLKVMLVWYDVTGTALSQDMDLTVAIGANTYLGNVFSNGWSVTGGTKDATNPQEGVFVSTASLPSSGAFTVTVAATNCPNGSPAGSYYSLVVTGDIVDNNSGPQGTLDKGVYECHNYVTGSIVDSGGLPTNAVYHSTTGGAYPAAISGSGPTYTVATVTTDMLGAVDGDTIWMTFTGHDSNAYTTSNSHLRCTLNISVSGAVPLTGGCDGDVYMDQGETLLLYPILQNNETFSTPTDFTADLVVDPSYPDANVVIVHTSGYFPAINAGGYGEPDPAYEVRYTGACGGSPILVHFLIQNIKAIDNSWTGQSAPSRTFTEYADTNDSVQTTYVNEGFDGTTFPPTNWVSTANVAGTASWARTTGMTHPTMTPYSGAGMAYFNSYNFTAPSAARLATPTFSLAGASIPKVNFYMTHDITYTNDDTIAVMLSLDGGTTYPTTLATLHRRDGGTVAGSWVQHSFDLSPYIGQTDVRIGFLATSAYGDNMAIDNVVVANFQRVADCVNCTSAVPVVAYSDGDWNFNDDRCNNLSDFVNFVPSMDAGESGDLVIYLSNSGNEIAYNVQGTLTCPSCPTYVNICKNTATWGDIPYGTSYVYGPTPDGFEIALGTNAVAGADLPFVLTLTATGYTPPVITTLPSPHTSASIRVGTVTIQGACTSPYAATTGTTTDVWYDNFTLAPTSVGTSGRCGPDWSTLGWTLGSGTTVATTITSAPTGDGWAARMTVVSTGGTTAGANFWRKFNTTGYDADVQLHSFIDLSASTVCALYLEYTPNSGTNWYILGGPWGGAGATDWGELGPFSLYWNIYDLTGSGFGPAAANAILNNPNFGLRFRAIRTSATTATYFYIDDVEVDLYKFVNQATTCTGVCLPPDPPEILAIDDLSNILNTGLAIYFDGSFTADSYDLYKDGVDVVVGFTNGGTYVPGDSSSHVYTVHGVNAYGNTASNAVSATDYPVSGCGSAPGAPVITAVNDVNACATSGVQVVYTPGSPAGTSYNLYKDGSLVVTGYVSGATYSPGDNASHTYVVRAICTPYTTDSAGVAGTDANNSPGAPNITAINDVDPCATSGVQIVYTAGSGASSHNLYDNGTLVVTGYSSGATYTPGDNNSHTYIVRAIAGSCYTNSTGVAGTDVDNTVGAPSITSITDVSACAATGIKVVYTAGSPAGTSYNLYKDGVSVVTGYVSNATYTPGDTASHTYVVRAIKGTCYADSTGVAGTDANGTPGVPTINSIVDVDACALSGIQVNFTPGSPAGLSYNLNRNGSTVVTGYVSGATYSPGATTTYSYTVVSVNGTCTATSTSSTFADANNGVGAPTITAVNDVSACAQSGVQVVYTAGSPAGTSYNLYKDGVSVVTGYTSATTYNPGDTSTHTYVVRSIKSTCYADSTGVAGTDVNNTPGATTITSITDVSTCLQNGIQVNFTGGSGAVSFNLYKDGVSMVTGYTSGATYNPGDTSTHTYVVRAINGSCTTDSSGVAGTDVSGVGCSSPPPGPTPTIPGSGGVTLDKSGANIAFVWSASKTSCSPTTWEIYRGSIGTWYSHSYQVTCDTLGNTNWTANAGLSDGNNYYYLIVAATSSKEGSYGQDSIGNQIPVSSNQCPGITQDLTSCTP